MARQAATTSRRNISGGRKVRKNIKHYLTVYSTAICRFYLYPSFDFKNVIVNSIFKTTFAFSFKIKIKEYEILSLTYQK